MIYGMSKNSFTSNIDLRKIKIIRIKNKETKQTLQGEQTKLGK